jgi:hypothetical protein
MIVKVVHVTMLSSFAWLVPEKVFENRYSCQVGWEKTIIVFFTRECKCEEPQADFFQGGSLLLCLLCHERPAALASL